MKDIVQLVLSGLEERAPMLAAAIQDEHDSYESVPITAARQRVVLGRRSGSMTGFDRVLVSGERVACEAGYRTGEQDPILTWVLDLVEEQLHRMAVDALAVLPRFCTEEWEALWTSIHPKISDIGTASGIRDVLSKWAKGPRVVSEADSPATYRARKIVSELDGNEFRALVDALQQLRADVRLTVEDLQVRLALRNPLV